MARPKKRMRHCFRNCIRLVCIEKYCLLVSAESLAESNKQMVKIKLHYELVIGFQSKK